MRRRRERDVIEGSQFDASRQLAHNRRLGGSSETLRPNVLALWLSGGVPCIVYMFTASGFAYWLDSGELVAAAVQLDIAHPPGHPLSALWGKAFAFLPLGALSFRVAIGQALATALASVACCRAILVALRGLRLDAWVSAPLAVLGAWVSTFTYALWFQAVRPEVYALQTLCVAAICERLLRAGDEPSRAGQHFAMACAILGLALANHHLIAFLLAPAFVPALVAIVRRRRWRVLTLGCGAGALGLSTYLYLPLRAAHAPPANLGDPSSWERFYWVVSARVYAHDMGSEAVQPLGTRLLDVVVLWLDDLSGLALLLAALGLYAGLRLASTRRATAVLALVWGVDAFARAWLGPVRANPDILGYLAPSYLALGAFIALFAGVLCNALEKHVSRRVLVALGWGAALSALGLLSRNAASSALTDFTATDDFDELRIRRLPPRAVVLESSPQTVFRSLELAAVEGGRPDVVHVPLPFLRYPGVDLALLQRSPSLRPTVEGYLAAHDHLTLAPLLALSRERPVFVELDPRVAPALYRHLTPRGVLTQVAITPEPVDHALLARTLGRLHAQLGVQQRETETAHQLLWIHYHNAVQLGALGLIAPAQSEVGRALVLHPQETRLHQLVSALHGAAVDSASTPGGASVDPAPFLQFDARAAP